MDETSEGTQWTTAARGRYVAAAEALERAVRAHAEATAAREGRQREHPAYFDSAGSLEVALRAFAEAEFDRCGSFPVALAAADGLEEESAPEEEQGGDVLTVLGRWDFRIEEPTALVDAGRAAYRQAWPQDTQDDTAVRVHDAVSAAAEILHTGDVGDLDETPGLARHRSSVQFLRHGGSTEEEVEEAPFALGADGA